SLYQRRRVSAPDGTGGLTALLPGRGAAEVLSIRLPFNLGNSALRGESFRRLSTTREKRPPAEPDSILSLSSGVSAPFFAITRRAPNSEPRKRSGLSWICWISSTVSGL